MSILFGVLQSIAQIFFSAWWIAIPLALFFIFRDFWLIYTRTKFVNKIKWKLFEIKIPKEILKSAKSMEQVFAGMYSMYSYGIKFLPKYVDGKVDTWCSWEMVGYAGGVHFYVYAPADKQSLIETSVYAQYPEAEISEVEDYTDLLPSVLPSETYDVWGTELTLARENYLPVKTYPSFESDIEEKTIDPIAAISETMSKLKEGEIIWLQILISPTGVATGNDWKKEGEEKIDEIVGRGKKGKEKGWFYEINLFVRNLILAPAEYPVWNGEKKSEEKMKFLSPDEQELIKAISGKISKLGFETIIRFVYIDRRDSFTASNIAAVMGSFHQFNTQNFNAFKPNYMITLFDSFLARLISRYKRFRVDYKKRRIFDYYKQRRFGGYNKTREEKFPVLNIEELATIYHFPAAPVKAPKLRQVEAKKGGPPAGLPIES